MWWSKTKKLEKKIDELNKKLSDKECEARILNDKVASLIKDKKSLKSEKERLKARIRKQERADALLEALTIAGFVAKDKKADFNADAIRQLSGLQAANNQLQANSFYNAAGMQRHSPLGSFGQFFY